MTAAGIRTEALLPHFFTSTFIAVLLEYLHMSILYATSIEVATIVDTLVSIHR